MSHALMTTRMAILASAVLFGTGHVGQASAQQSPPAAASTSKQSSPRAASPSKGKSKEKAQTAAAAAKQDPVEAQRMLAAGQAALAAGKADAAVESFNGALAGRGLGPTDMAKALYLRGAAYRKLAKPALAIADLNGALYIRKGLADADRKDADEQRAAAYREAGLPDQRVTPVAAQQSEAPPTTAALPAARQVSPSPSPAVAAASPPRSQPSSSNGPLGSVGSFIGSLFGSAPAQPEAPEPAVAAQAPNAVSSWSTRTDQRPAVSVSRTAAPAAVASTSTSRTIDLQLANLRDRTEAESLAERVKQQNAGDLGARTVTVVENVAGSFGRLYAVRVGPFASADDSRALCTSFRKQGLDCLSVSSP